MKLLRISIGALALALLTASAAIAAQELVIKSDETQLLNVSGSPGAVVIGNPSIADATVHGTKIFLHGRAAGSTNLIVLDQEGNQLASMEITVQVNGENNVALFKAGNRYSYVCATLCEEAMRPGDQVDYFSDVMKMNSNKSDFASGKSSADSATAPVAQ